MKRRWYYFKWIMRVNRPVILGLAGLLIAGILLFGKREKAAEAVLTLYEQYGVQTAGAVIKHWLPEPESEEGHGWYWLIERPEVIKYLETLPRETEYGEDPAYERMLANAWERRIQEENEPYVQWDEREDVSSEDGAVSVIKETVSVRSPGNDVIREKLADYDYLMKNFYSVHPTTTAGRDLINADRFLQMDLSLERIPDQPQILIYHTHSQESFSDYPENENATIVGVGAYLKALLEERGYSVIHDMTVYDMREGKLDRSQAYTYALDGITGILQEYPSIEVVLDLHRDGVNEGTHLVTDVSGKPTAQIMFFNGTSQTPDGPIEYLPNSNREANMAFSFQMQLKASEQYPGFTRRIYLKGLRYNQHVRARTALIEVGAQTNTYAEALNAMEPLADILSQVLDGE